MNTNLTNEEASSRAGMYVAQLVKCLPSMNKARVQSSAQPKLGVVGNACHPSTEEVEAGQSNAQSHRQLQSELEASLDYTRLY